MSGRPGREATRFPGIWRYPTKAGTRYRVVVEAGRDPLTGKRIQKTRSGLTTLDAAKKARAELLIDEEIAGPNWTVAELAARWLAEVERTGRVRPGTVMKYERRLTNHLLPALGTTRAREVTTLVLQGRYDAMVAAGAGPHTLASVQVVARAMFGRAVVWGVVATNPAIGVMLPRRAASAGRVLSADEARRVLAAIDDDTVDGALVWVLLIGGLRVGEALALRWVDLDARSGVLTIARTVTVNRQNRRVIGEAPKTDAGRRAVALTPGCLAALERQRARVAARAAADPEWIDEGLIFPGRHGRPQNARTPTERFRALCARAGVAPVRIHDLRHTSATLLRAAGVDAEIVARRLGHASTAMTARYTHFGAADQAAAVAAIGAAMGERGSGGAARDPGVTRRRGRARRGGGNGAKRRGKPGARGRPARGHQHLYSGGDGDGDDVSVTVSGQTSPE